MKALIVATGSPLQLALSQQFQQRQRACKVLSPAQLAQLEAPQLDGAVVIELASLEALQAGLPVPIAAQDRRRLLELCRARSTPLLMLSDGRVFDGGEAPLNHRENESPHPASVAGGQLSALETQLAGALEEYLVLRTGPVFSERGDNALTRLFQAMVAGEHLQLSTGLKCCPTHVKDLARVLSGIVDQLSVGAQCWGIYHYNSSGQTSAYEFAEVIYAFASQRVDLVSAAPELVACEGGQGIEPAVPVLRCDKILQHFGIKQLPWRSYLPKALKVLCEGDSK